MGCEKLFYTPSGIRGVGGVTTVHPAFLNMSICRRSSWFSECVRAALTTHQQQVAAEITRAITNLPAGSIRVGQHQAWSDDVECGVDVHGVRVFKGYDVDLVGRGKMTPHPLNAHVVCNL